MKEGRRKRPLSGKINNKKREIWERASRAFKRGETYG